VTGASPEARQNEAGGHASAVDVRARGRVSLNGVSTGTWTLDRDIRLCADVGVAKVGIPVAKMDAVGADDVAALLRDAQIGVSSVLVPEAFRLSAPETWDERRRELCAMVDVAQTIAADCVYMTAGPPGSRVPTDVAAARFMDAIRPVQQHAATRGVPIALEHNHALRRDIGFIHSLRDMVDFADDADLDICVELNNCWIERDLADTFRRGVHRFAVVQVSDYSIGTFQTPDRRVPGDGDIPLEHLLELLLDCGYGGVFELELLGPHIDTEGVGEASRRGLEWLLATLDRLTR
jgi:sugar phosphate isomerase/epimerase